MTQKLWTFYNGGIMLLSWLLYILYLIYMDNSSTSTSEATISAVKMSLIFYLCFILVVGFNFLIDFATNSYKALFSNSLAQELKILIKTYIKLDEIDEIGDNEKKSIEYWLDKLKDDTSNLEEDEEVVKGGTSRSKKANTRGLAKIDRVSMEKIESHSQERLNNEDKYSPVQIKE